MTIRFREWGLPLGKVALRHRSWTGDPPGLVWGGLFPRGHPLHAACPLGGTGPGAETKLSGVSAWSLQEIKGREKGKKGKEMKRKRTTQWSEAGPPPSGGTHWAGGPPQPAAAQQARILSSDELSPPPSEWASSEVAAPRPAPTPPGRRNPELPCPGGWGTPLGTVLGAPSAGPHFPGRPWTDRCPAVPGKRLRCVPAPRCLWPRLQATLKPDLWGGGGGEEGSGRRWAAGSGARKPGGWGLGGGWLFPVSPVT